MNPSSSLQIPDPSMAGPSRQHGSSRPVSVSVQPTSASASHPSRKRASHTVVSSQQQHQQQIDDQPAYHDVYSHPAAVAYAAAHPRRTIPKFGPYLLLQTLGEGEFGKVKLGLHSQWGEEVAVKLIRRGNIDTAVRMSKVEREIEVLRTLKHPNIVRLYDVIETDKYIGIILEYASGGELFDHILAHRYLKERDAAKLFSQLISGVWYIHQKKIVHRDLKLENLLLDRHRNVIITDFGFANRFEHRSDDLMNTSCGSPCYAAPELVISEGAYVGSAVDIWSCGVILYAMLAGYLPFDDDPANPDGDNINLLYKYIVNTPLSFPDYISPEARDLLSLMLVPEPTHRADLRAVMAHPWLAAYAHTFLRTVDDLERAAMEQHQMKRLAYQKQMKQAAAAAEVHTKVSRTQSARTDPFHASPSAPASSGPTSSQSPSRSRSHRDHASPQQPDYVYETSLDQSMYSPPSSAPPTSSRKVVSSAMSPPPVDDDPFGVSGQNKALPIISSPMDNMAGMNESRPETRTRRSSSGQGRSSSKTRSPPMPPAAPAAVKVSTPDNGKKKAGGFRHTIQVEYDDPVAADPPRRTPSKSARETDAMPSRQMEDSRPAQGRERMNSQNGTSGTPERAARRQRTPQGTSAAPLPNPPLTSSPSTRSNRPRVASTGNSSPGTPSRQDPPVVSVNAASPPAAPAVNTEEKTLQTMHSGGSTGSQSSSRHRKGLSVDKLGLGKIFGSGSTPEQYQNGTGGAASRVPSESSANAGSINTDTSANGIKGHQVSSNAPPANQKTQSKTSLLSPVAENGKKSRRNTLTVMVEPLSRTFKSRSKGRNGTIDTPVKEKLVEKPDQFGTVPSQSNPALQSQPSNNSRTDIGAIGLGMPASTNKARKVMQWFRTKSKGGPDSAYDTQNESAGEESEKRVPTPTQTAVTPQVSSAAAASSSTINQVTSPVLFVTSPTSPRAPGHAKRTASSATDASFSPQSLAARIRNSVGVIGAPSPPRAAGILRIHHGAVDQTTITSRPPPEVMKHVREVLAGMGVEIQVESEYKYRCIRPKKKKAAAGAGLGARETGSGAGLAAFTMVGTAASNGVDKRGLPLPSQPSTFHGTGGMLRGLLMRRQSSQVSTHGMNASQPSLSLEDDTVIPSATTPEEIASSSPSPVYGDIPTDAGDEVRFSVELTKLDRLNDMFSLDIRRLKGNLRSYKFLYDTLRDRADLQR